MAVEEPKYTATEVSPPFELRHYSGRIAAEVTITGTREAAVNDGFRLLAGYIFGSNTTKKQIKMTSPVTQTQDRSQKIAMTAPVMQTPSGQNWVVRFIMPAEYSLETLPTPMDPRVHLVALPASDEAVVRFSGLTQADDIDKQTKALMGYVEAHHWKGLGPVTLARYDPPWTLWLMRRNELMIPVAINAKP